jgi:hypothetical protein
MIVLPGALVQLPVPINLSAHKEHFQPFATIDYSRCGISLWQYVGKIKFAGLITSVPLLNKFPNWH